jgi:formylglycine-generating enzyme required for sulfatase activity
VQKPDHAKLKFALALSLISASAAVGMYRTQRGAQVFSRPLFDPVAPTEVITASQLANTALPPLPTASTLRTVEAASEVAFRPNVLADSVSRTLNARAPLSRDALRQLRALFAKNAATSLGATRTELSAARTEVLVALLAATRARVPEALLQDAATLMASLSDLSDSAARRLRARFKAAIAREDKLARAEALLRTLPMSIEQLTLAAGNFTAVLKADTSSARAARGLDALEAATVQSSAQFSARNQFPEAHALLDFAEKQVQGGGPIRAERAALFVAQANAESALLQQFSRALAAKQSAAAAETLAQLARFLPPERINPMRMQITNAELYGGFERAQSFSDSFAASNSASTLRGPLLRVVPTGSFVMGSPPNEASRAATEGPQRELRITQGFAIAVSETSLAQFGAFVAATGYQTDAERGGDSVVYEQANGRMVRRKGIDWRHDYLGQPAAENLPVLHVSYNDASDYARWLSRATGQRYRLPSEAEFEYALRAGKKSRFAWGNSSPEQAVENLTGTADRSDSGRTWSAGFADYGDAFWGPAPVQSFLPNAFGLRDMGGNASEWSADCWHESYARAPVGVLAWENPGCAQRVVRGGSWASTPEESRAASRTPFNASYRSAKIGFRVVREL